MTKKAAQNKEKIIEARSYKTWSNNESSFISKYQQKFAAIIQNQL
jgi:hypothetical protein